MTGTPTAEMTAEEFSEWAYQVALCVQHEEWTISQLEADIEETLIRAYQRGQQSTDTYANGHKAGAEAMREAAAGVAYRKHKTAIRKRSKDIAAQLIEQDIRSLELPTPNSGE